MSITDEKSGGSTVVDRRVYTATEISQILGIGMTNTYQLIKEGHFRTVRIGTAIRISKKSFDDWLDLLEIEGSVKCPRQYTSRSSRK